jgi:hypothetical protein
MAGVYFSIASPSGSRNHRVATGCCPNSKNNCFLGGTGMSVYLKVLPAVLLEPDVLLDLGQKICLIVRDTLILDRRMEDICNAIEREGRTLKEVIDRDTTSPFTADLDEAALSCEKACSLLKAAVQHNLFDADSPRVSSAMQLYGVLEGKRKNSSRSGNSPVSERIRDIITSLGTEQMQQALTMLHLQKNFQTLRDTFQTCETVYFENNLLHKTEQLPTLRSIIALYGMLIDTLIANVRFENYLLLHRVETVLARIETVVAEAMEETVRRQMAITDPSAISEAEPR